MVGLDFGRTRRLLAFENLFWDFIKIIGVKLNETSILDTI